MAHKSSAFTGFGDVLVGYSGKHLGFPFWRCTTQVIFLEFGRHRLLDEEALKFDPLTRLCLNRTNGKDSRVKLRTNFLSITCCAMKRKEIMQFATNCYLAQLVGLSYAERLVFESGRFSFLFLPFSKFLSLVSFLRVRLSVRVRFSVSVRVRIRVKVRF